MASSSLWQSHACCNRRAEASFRLSPILFFHLALLTTDSRSALLLHSVQRADVDVVRDHPSRQVRSWQTHRPSACSRARYPFWQFRAATARCIIRVDRPAFCYIHRVPGSEGRRDRGCIVSEVGMFVDKTQFFVIPRRGCISLSLTLPPFAAVHPLSLQSVSE